MEHLSKHRGIEAAENNLAMLLVTYRKDQKSFDRANELTQQFANSGRNSRWQLRPVRLALQQYETLGVF